MKTYNLTGIPQGCRILIHRPGNPGTKIAPLCSDLESRQLGQSQGGFKMRKFLVLGLLMFAFSVSAFGQIIDPNVGFCAPPASATACQGQPDTNPISGTSFGMWSFGSNNSSTPWYLLVAVPQATFATIASPPAITGTGFTLSFTTQKEFLPTTSGVIYDLFTQTAGTGGASSLNASNLFGSLEQAAFGGTPGDFDVLLYTVSGAFNGNTAYSFTVSPGLAAGTVLGAENVNGNIAFATPWTTAGLVNGPPSVPDGGMTLMLLGGALVGLEALRRRVRA
jgi:hypothetical protein